MEIAQDEKNKELLAAQIHVLQEKQEEIDKQIAKKKITYAKVSDTLGIQHNILTVTSTC